MSLTSTAAGRAARSRTDGVPAQSRRALEAEMRYLCERIIKASNELAVCVPRALELQRLLNN